MPFAVLRTPTRAATGEPPARDEKFAERAAVPPKPGRSPLEKPWDRWKRAEVPGDPHPALSRLSRDQAIERSRNWHDDGDARAPLLLGGLGLATLPPIDDRVRVLDVSDNPLRAMPAKLPPRLEVLRATGLPRDTALPPLPSNLRVIHADPDRTVRGLPVGAMLNPSPADLERAEARLRAARMPAPADRGVFVAKAP